MLEWLGSQCLRCKGNWINLVLQKGFARTVERKDIMSKTARKRVMEMKPKHQHGTRSPGTWPNKLKESILHL